MVFVRAMLFIELVQPVISGNFEIEEERILLVVYGRFGFRGVRLRFYLSQRP